MRIPSTRPDAAMVRDGQVNVVTGRRRGRHGWVSQPDVSRYEPLFHSCQEPLASSAGQGSPRDIPTPNARRGPQDRRRRSRFRCQDGRGGGTTSPAGTMRLRSSRRSSLGRSSGSTSPQACLMSAGRTAASNHPGIADKNRWPWRHPQGPASRRWPSGEPTSTRQGCWSTP